MKNEYRDEDAHAVMAEMRSIQNQIGRLMARLEFRRHLDREEKIELQNMLRAIKERLKKAAKYGTIDGTARQRSAYENDYFRWAVAKASAHCSVAVNSHPFESNWYSCLYDMETDIGPLLFQLDQQFPTFAPSDNS